MLGVEDVDITCTVTYEQLAPSGECQKKSVHKNSTLSLGRNEFHDVVLKLSIGARDSTHRLDPHSVVVHRKFAAEGKATIRLSKSGMQLLLSNCPPNRLQTFLRTLVGKLGVQKVGPARLNARARLLSVKPAAFHEISPLSMKDAQTVMGARLRAAEQRSVQPGTTKRKRGHDEDKENRPPKGIKIVAGKAIIEQGALRPVHTLTSEQKKVLQAVMSGQSLFFTGSAGTGKSFLLRKIIGSLPPQHTFATASTGVAACHIAGTTLHGFAGMGSGKSTIAQCIELASRPTVAQNWKRCKHLIIDEISMVDGDFFDKLEHVARAVRKNDEPFGGIQLILCGDFLQLPPVTASGEKRKFAFQSHAWRKCNFAYMELREVRRQADRAFVNILQSIRLGRCSEEISNLLSATSKNRVERDGIVATRLCTHKEDVDMINRLQMGTLAGESRLFTASDSDPALAKRLDSQCPVREHLELKQGAQVMLAKNLDVQKGFVNGARGVIVGFDSTHGYPNVKFMCGQTAVIRPERWSIKAAGGIYLTRRQLPLQLAWAISIHKSQGMSLDCVEISLSRVFECGQTYVALSRATNMRGLRVLDFNRACVRADPDVLQFYKRMQQHARPVSAQTTIDGYVSR